MKPSLCKGHTANLQHLRNFKSARQRKLEEREKPESILSFIGKVFLSAMSGAVIGISIIAFEQYMRRKIQQRQDSLPKTVKEDKEEKVETVQKVEEHVNKAPELDLTDSITTERSAQELLASWKAQNTSKKEGETAVEEDKMSTEE